MGCEDDLPFVRAHARRRVRWAPGISGNDMNKLTPFEERLRKRHFVRAIGHNPQAADCLWSQPGDDRPKETCATCHPRRPCSHPWRHTVYGERGGGTTCVLCGKKLN